MAGINTVPFEPSSAREGEERTVVGLGVSDGRLIAPPAPRFDALVFYRDGRAAIVAQWELQTADSEDSPGKALPPGILHAVGGFHCVLRDGELTERARRKSPRYARSAAGLSENGGVLYLVAINGGRLMNRGATEAETALILKQLGAQDALNLDGGGSSALVLRFPNGGTDGSADGTADGAANGVTILNTPVHAGLPGRERAVALCLGIGQDTVSGD
jgi:exopolysaccharide biosynthesis protein